jgi:small-conductance mechanosensitive channel
MSSDLTQVSAHVTDGFRAAAIMAGFLIAMLAVRLLWGRVIEPAARRAHRSLEGTALLPLRTLVLWGLLLLGLYHSLNSLHAVHEHRTIAPTMAKTLSAAWVLLAVWFALRMVRAFAAWYGERAAEAGDGGRDIGPEVALGRKVASVVILALGALYLLSTLGLNIGPLLAGGAVGGVVLAVALQDTLSNLFAGLFISLDRPVSVGDYIKLQSGEEGFVVEIGWRSTKVRLWANNVVVIPNSLLSKSLVTNYFLPEQEMSVYVPCGVAYDSDLERVERVTVEVAKEVMDRVHGASTDWQPVVRWKEFADSAITFVTALRVCEFGAQYELQSEFIKALLQRFREEEIVIPFPIRTVVMQQSPRASGTDGKVRGLATRGAAEDAGLRG